MAPKAAPPAPGPRADARPTDPRPGPSNRSEWLGSWRVALRLARRDIRRHRGRSALVVVMVALPVLMLVAGNVVFSTQQLSPAERIPYAMGQTQAAIEFGGEYRQTPMPDPRRSFGMPRGEPMRALPIPGWGPSPAEQAAAIGALVGSAAYPVYALPGQATLGRRVVDLEVLAVDAGAHRSAQGLVRLRSGRWPATPGEAVVTRAGLAAGLPETGTITVANRNLNTDAGYVIVGVADGYQQIGDSVRVVHLVVPPLTTLPTGMTALPAQVSYLVDRPTPVTWDEVKRLADYGLLVTSRQVLLDPPPASEVQLPPGMADDAAQAAMSQVLVAAVMAVGLLLETMLLVGPAFAVSAARQRRTLALAASNGAATAHLRRTVLAQALVLGALAALSGAALGLLTARLLISWSDSAHPEVFFGPFDLPAGPLTVVVGCAVVSAVVAALIPARGLARLDIVAVMRGQSVSPAARVRTPVAGLACLAAGTVGVFWTFAQTATSASLLGQLLPFIAMASLGLVVVGALLLVPMALVGAARLTRSAPAPWRMAMRDAARQRGRATSTVAAILGATALLASILVGTASVNAFGAAHYFPQLPFGQASVTPREMPVRDSASWAAEVRAAAREAEPALRVVLTEIADVDVSPTRDLIGQVPFLVALRRGCSAEQALSVTGAGRPGGPPEVRCLSLRAGLSDDRGAIRVGELAELVAAYRLDATQERVLRDGGLVVIADPAPKVEFIQGDDGSWGSRDRPGGQVDLVDGQVVFARGVQRFTDDRAPSLEQVSTFRVPATTAPFDQLNPQLSFGLGYPLSYGALMTTQTGARLGLGTAVIDARIIDPRGPLGPQAAESLAFAAAEQGLGTFYVERGYVPYDTLVALIVGGILGLIILVATLVATALSTAETQSLMGTFAAVGATRRTRRALAAAQAASLGLVGTLLGVLVGLVPGIAMARASTAYDPDGVAGTTHVDPTVVVPWLHLLVPVLGVPALAAGLAWAAIRRTPTVTRRLT